VPFPDETETPPDQGWQLSPGPEKKNRETGKRGRQKRKKKRKKTCVLHSAQSEKEEGKSGGKQGVSQGVAKQAGKDRFGKTALRTK